MDSGYADGGWDPVWTPHGSNEYLVQCPTCTDVGWLEGYVYDYDMGAPCTDATVHVEPGNLDSRITFTAPSNGEYTVLANSRGAGETGAYTVSIVTAAGGRIQLESSTPEGTSFLVVLPAVGPKTPPASTADHPA